jgi:hypothetical protein
MDPTAPRRPQDLATAKRQLTRVQQWVMSVLAVSTILHLSAGLVLAAVFLPAERGVSSQIGLNVIAAAFGVAAVATGLGIHRRNLLSPWLLLGLLPGAVGVWLTV